MTTNEIRLQLQRKRRFELPNFKDLGINDEKLHK